MILGIGGVRALRALGVQPAVWHMNEGHAAFLILELLREHVASGLPFAAALEAVAAACVFTTHTPVAAGHDAFDPDLIVAQLRRISFASSAYPSSACWSWRVRPAHRSCST